MPARRIVAGILLGLLLAASLQGGHLSQASASLPGLDTALGAAMVPSEFGRVLFGDSFVADLSGPVIAGGQDWASSGPAAPADPGPVASAPPAAPAPEPAPAPA
ncbi:MAG: hypothetical protein AB1645_09575, partial [Bacillota bacterium]